MNLRKITSKFSKVVSGSDEGIIFNSQIMDDALCVLERLDSRNKELSVICDRFGCDSVTAILMCIHFYSVFLQPDDDDFSDELRENPFAEIGDFLHKIADILVSNFGEFDFNVRREFGLSSLGGILGLLSKASERPLNTKRKSVS